MGRPEAAAALRVLKFGGACLESLGRLHKVVELVAHTPRPVAVVVSAVAGVTDRLHGILREPADRSATRRFVADLGAFHLGLAPRPHCIDDELSVLLTELQRRLDAARTSPGDQEWILSAGERLAAVLVASHMRCEGLEARSFSAERAGLYCDDRYGSASLDFQATRRGVARSLRPYLATGGVPVVTGYFGITPHGDVATFGRSGTDYTATALAQVLGAERIELWKAVGGFLDADPQIIPEAQVIPRLSYQEAIELSFYGARVIHPRALDPARDCGIPIYIFDVDDQTLPGTRISAETSHRAGELTAVSCRRSLAMLRAYARAGTGHDGTMAVVARHLVEAGVDVLSTSTAQRSLGLLIDAADRSRAEAALGELPARLIEQIEVTDGSALVCVVGHGLGDTRGMVGRVLCAVVRSRVEVEMVAAGASPVACHLVVAERDLEVATRAIYREFFNAPARDKRLCVWSAKQAPAAERDGDAAESRA